MDDKAKLSVDANISKSTGGPRLPSPALNYFAQVPQKLQNSLKLRLKQLLKTNHVPGFGKPAVPTEEESDSSFEVDLDKQLQAWRSNSNWSDEPPEIKVSVPKGSLCNLNVRFKAGLPPDAIYNIVIDPENKRVFKNIKEVISRKVLVDEGQRQVVEVEQAAIWRFLWWSGTIAVHVFVDQNRKDHTVKFKQGKSGFMERFEGCWKVEPLFVDEQTCLPFRPKTFAEYNTCTGGKGRVGSLVSLDQLIQPSIVPPPPISWYLRGITTKTTEMLINDLLAEATRLRRSISDAELMQDIEARSVSGSKELVLSSVNDIKERWQQRRSARHRRRLERVSVH
ncbi:uncharacterized protein LOC109722620 [Ananas comosus]|uniref:Uncharacterized protein LOC109722620 n=1 Tax=Ananas comosus TaxID=4615 RepID=A0A6P5GEA2_ANACO|nr:uncharacterized protein LOC109722620 [Ananas comosus]